MNGGHFRGTTSRYLSAYALTIGLIGVFGPAAFAADKPGAEKNKKQPFIDQMIQQGWEEASIKPSPIAPDAEFMRRETPFSFFNIISAGKGTSMPAWAMMSTKMPRREAVTFGALRKSTSFR